MLDDLALFIKIVEAGSLNAAAQLVKLPPSTLTRRLQKLERQLNCKLLIRSARRLVPTHEGWQYFEQCRPLVNALQQTAEQLDETLNQVSGEIRVLAPVNLANGLLASAWMAFMQQYPKVRLSLALSNHTEDLISKGADLAIRIGEQPDSSLNIRRLGVIRKNLLVASPDYIKELSTAITPENLVQHSLIVAEPLAVWWLINQYTQEQIRIVPQGRLTVNEIGLALDMACQGMGVFYCPISLCDHLLQRGTLVPVLPDWYSASRTIYAVWPQQHYVPARVRALIDHLIEYCRHQPLINGSCDE